MDPCKNGRAGEVFLCINLQGILVGTPISFVLRKLLAKAMIFVVRHTSSKKCLQRHLYKKGHLCPRGLLHGKKHFLSALCRLSYRRLGVRYGTTQVGKGLLCLVASTGNTNGYILQQQLQRLPRSPELRRPQRRLHGRRQPLLRSFSQTRFWCSRWCREVFRTTNTIAFAKSLPGTKQLVSRLGPPTDCRKGKRPRPYYSCQGSCTKSSGIGKLDVWATSCCCCRRRCCAIPGE